MESDAEFNGNKKIKRRRIAWSPAAEEYLVKLWAKKYDDLRAERRNIHVYRDISDEMNYAGFDYSVVDIKVKLHNLTTKYRQCKMKTAPVDWEFFDAVHNILSGQGDVNDESSSGRLEKSSNFDFIESESLMAEVDFLPEEQLTATPSVEHSKSENKFSQQKSSFNNFHSKRHHAAETEAFSLDHIKRIKRDNIDSGGSGQCLDKLANTVNDVVKFVMKIETEKGRNDAFYKVLESYLSQLPESTQDELKIDLLNTVFAKIKKAEVDDEPVDEHNHE